MQTIGQCFITTKKDVDTLQFDWGIIHMLAHKGATGGSTFSFGVVELQQGKGHIRHNHPTADEAIYVISGEAEQMLDDQEPVTIKQGDCIWIPKAIYHSTINRSDKPVQLIVVYSPAGAEQALWDDPTVSITPPDDKK